MASLVAHSNLESRTADIQLVEKMDFSQLMLSDEVLRGLTSTGFKQPSPIQLEAIPICRIGANVVVQSKSGTGKTLVFVVATLEALKLDRRFIGDPVTQASNHVQHGPFAIVFCPTQEIATQVSQVFDWVGRWFQPKLRIGTFVGGMKVSKNVKKWAETDIAVGTPGRLSHMMRECPNSTDDVRLLILDEADQLLDSDFRQNLRWVFTHMPNFKQTILCSATFPRDIFELVKQYTSDPVVVRAKTNEAGVTDAPEQADLQLIGICQYYVEIPPEMRFAPEFEDDDAMRLGVVDYLLKQIEFDQCIIFCSTQGTSDLVFKWLKSHQYQALHLSAILDRVARDRNLKDMQKFRTRIIVATDVIARGVDCKGVNLIVNYDVPMALETYLHRIGRAGRYGGHGASITLLSDFLPSERERFSSWCTSGGLHAKELVLFSLTLEDPSGTALPPEQRTVQFLPVAKDLLKNTSLYAQLPVGAPAEKCPRFAELREIFFPKGARPPSSRTAPSRGRGASSRGKGRGSSKKVTDWDAPPPEDEPEMNFVPLRPRPKRTVEQNASSEVVQDPPTSMLRKAENENTGLPSLDQSVARSNLEQDLTLARSVEQAEPKEKECSRTQVSDVNSSMEAASPLENSMPIHRYASERMREIGTAAIESGQAKRSWAMIEKNKTVLELGEAKEARDAGEEAPSEAAVVEGVERMALE